jgi:hypothetical protein
MRNTLMSGIALASLVFTAAAAFACGDKMVLLPASARYRQVTAGAHPASILAYVPQSSALSDVVRDIESQSAAKHVGHKVRAVVNSVQLEEALQTERYDVLLTDAVAAEDIQQRARSSLSMPVVLPVVFKSTRAEANAIEKSFHCLMKAPASPNNYMTAIDEAMALKAKTH